MQKTLKYERAMLSPSKPLNPPTLQEFIQRHAYTKLKASINGEIMTLREEGGRLVMVGEFWHEQQGTVKRLLELQEDIAS